MEAWRDFAFLPLTLVLGGTREFVICSVLSLRYALGCMYLDQDQATILRTVVCCKQTP
jgi:hypothetical protein